jgi:ribosome-binding factor A
MARINKQLQMNLADIVPSAINDPRISKVEMMTVTGVRASPDLATAKVLVAVKGGDEETKDAMKALKGASGFLRSELGRRVSMRSTPKLRFILDTTAIQAANIERILHEIEVERGEEDGQG